MKRRFRDESGVTLLELMMAAGIMAMALSMLFGGLISVSSMGDVAEEREAASTVITSITEELSDTMDFEDLLSYLPPYFADIGKNPPTIEMECYDANGAAIPMPILVTQTTTESSEGEGEGESVTESSGDLVQASGLSLDLSTLPNPLEVKITVTWENSRGHILPLSSSAMCYWR